MKKEIIFGFVNLCLICLCLFLLIFCNIADDLVLLECVHPEYWNYLEKADDEYGEVLKTTVNITNRCNYIINKLGDIEGDGFTVKTNPDGSISFSGINRSDKTLLYHFYGVDPVYLPDGRYRYTDGNDSGIDGIYTYIEGICYEVGGITNYTELVNRAWINGGEGVFYADHNKYDWYSGVLVIASGFSSDIVTLKPMISKYDTDDNCKFEPCLSPMSYYESNDIYRYRVIKTYKDYMEEIDKEDLQMLLRESQMLYKDLDWVSICFEDGTGICFSESCGPLYGNINDCGMILEPKTFLEIDQPIYSQIAEYGNKRKLSENRAFYSYLKELEEYKSSGYVIIMSLKNESKHDTINPLNLDKALREFGIKSDYFDILDKNFMVIFDDGQNINEICSMNEIEYSGVLDDGISYVVKSSRSSEENCASIIINEFEYSMNKRGINIVVYDKNLKAVIDTVAYDTLAHLEVSRPKVISGN